MCVILREIVDFLKKYVEIPYKICAKSAFLQEKHIFVSIGIRISRKIQNLQKIYFPHSLQISVQNAMKNIICFSLETKKLNFRKEIPQVSLDNLQKQ